MKLFTRFLAVMVLLPLAFSAWAQPDRYVAGTHYTELSAPVRTSDPSRVEVVEAFWYGCSHCYRFEPLLNSWVADLPEDVDFVHFPAMWNQLMKVHAQVYYTAEALGKLDEMHGPIFDAINAQGNRLMNERQIRDFFAQYGVSEEDFERAFNGFSVRTKVSQAEAKMQDYQIRSTPNMIVNGKYLITTGQAVPTQQEMLNVVDFLIEKERATLRSGASGE